MKYAVCITRGEREGFGEILMDNYECKVCGRDGENSMLLACYLDKVQSLQFTYIFYCNIEPSDTLPTTMYTMLIFNSIFK